MKKEMRPRPGLVAALLLVLPFAPVIAQQPSETEQQFGGEYSSLKPEQQRLIDDWFHRFSQVIEKPVDPEEAYNKIPLSVKTTFNGVTHALMNTKLTDKSGKSLGESALTLVTKVDKVAGKIPGAGGDQQFRIYVALKPGAREILADSQEFNRTMDNTIFHKGFPTSYRGATGTPSIQFSISKDGTRADIDVDYRSSKFPAVLISGHLTASNSDVRAGKNDQRHNQQWSGLRNWWRNLLGLPIFEELQPVGGEDTVMSREPSIKGNAPPEKAVYDFLNSWLVEQNPEAAIAYFDEDAFACMEIERGEHVDDGMARYALLMGMREVNGQLGAPAALADVSLGIRLTGPRGRIINQPHQGEFALYNIREDLAEQFRCVNRLESAVPTKAAQSKAFGKYWLAVFRIQGAGRTGETVATLWQKSKGYWRMISYDVEPEFDSYRVPNTAPEPPETPELAYVPGDKDLVRASREFLKDWLVNGQIEPALEYFSPSAYSCVNLYRDDETPNAATPEEQTRLLGAGLREVADATAGAKKLDRAITAPIPGHPDLKLVKHSRRSAYVIASLPDYMGAAANCSGRKPGETPEFEPPAGAPSYGSYYGVGLKLASTVHDPSVLWTVWAKESGEWKIVSYLVLMP